MTDTSAGIACAVHPSMVAEAACSVCGRGACAICCKRVNTAPFCEACAAGREAQLPWLAGGFAAVFPGLGQLYNGELGKAAAVLLLAPLLLISWGFGIVDAVLVARRIRDGERDHSKVPTGVVLVVLKVVLVLMPVVCFGLLGLGVWAWLRWFK